MKAKHGSQLKFDFLVRNHVTLGNNCSFRLCFFLLWSSQDTADSAIVLEN